LTLCLISLYVLFFDRGWKYFFKHSDHEANDKIFYF
jgi:hypothetical protein